MASKDDEMILVIPSAPFTATKAADASDADKARAITANYEASMHVPGVAQLRRRGDMEENEKFVQPIPYTVLYHLDHDAVDKFCNAGADLYEGVQILSYKRGTEGGEARLHNMYSVGFGGHINSTDVVNAFSEYSSSNIMDVTVEIACAARELKEELGVDITTSKDVILDNTICKPYVFYDTSSKVSSRHICKAMCFNVLDMASIKAEEDCIKKLAWVPLKELCENMDNMESWSKIVVAYTKAIFDDIQRTAELKDGYCKLNTAVRDVFKENEELYHRVVDDKDEEAEKQLYALVMSNPNIQPKVHPKCEAFQEIIDSYRRAAEWQRLPGIVNYPNPQQQSLPEIVGRPIPAIKEKSKLQIRPE